MKNYSPFTEKLSALVPQCLRAFTLAETLIVIGIIGVVAALTLPNLNHATGDKEKVTRVKKIYSSLTDAFDRAQVIYGPYDEWYKNLDDKDFSKNASTCFAKRVTEFMKVSKDCGQDSGCWSEAPLINSKNEVIDGTQNYYKDFAKWLNADTLLLSDGTALLFDGGWSDYIKVDIDGPNKGKTMAGNDIFSFRVYTDENNVSSLLPDCNYSFSNVSWNDSLGIEAYGGYYTKWVIENGNLDYLKCPDDLDWSSQTSCK